MTVKNVLRLLMICVALVGLACDERTEETDSGGVLLEVEFSGDGVPVFISVNGTFAVNGEVAVGSIDINSIVVNNAAPTSALMDIELEALEVTFRRVDSGTRVPPPYVERILGTVPVGGTLTLNNWPIMSTDQLRNPPIEDLLFQNGGFDKETGDTIIRMDLIVRVFGRTLGNRRVESRPRPHTIEFRQ